MSAFTCLLDLQFRQFPPTEKPDSPATDANHENSIQPPEANSIQTMHHANIDPFRHYQT